MLDALRPYTKEEGGVLEVEHVSYVEGRSNLIIKYPGTSDKTVGFVGRWAGPHGERRGCSD